MPELTVAEGHRLNRLYRVTVGNCGWCNKPRSQFKWLCDECAEKHRMKQRKAALMKRIGKAMQKERENEAQSKPGQELRNNAPQTPTPSAESAA